jgi:hypothetical protein
MHKSWLGAVLALLSPAARFAAARRETRSEALRDPATTSLGRIVAGEESGKNLSGIRLLSSGEEALADLIALADHAERTLDIQYYIIHRTNRRGFCCITCAWRPSGACGCACWSTISTRRARIGGSCTWANTPTSRSSVQSVSRR